MLALFRRRQEAAETYGGIDPQRLILDVRYVVMDTELTGLDPRKDSIVSLGAVAMEGGRIMLGEQLSEILSPATELRSESVVVHGITPTEARACPTFESVIGRFLRFCEDAIVVGHFLSLDLGFLNKELKRLGAKRFVRPAVDTLKLHEWMQEQRGKFSRHYDSAIQDRDLFSLARKYQIPVSAAHDAQMDAFITAQLFQRFLQQLPDLGVSTIRDLLRIGRP